MEKRGALKFETVARTQEAWPGIRRFEAEGGRCPQGKFFELQGGAAGALDGGFEASGVDKKRFFKDTRPEPRWA